MLNIFNLAISFAVSLFRVLQNRVSKGLKLLVLLLLLLLKLLSCLVRLISSVNNKIVVQISIYLRRYIERIVDTNAGACL